MAVPAMCMNLLALFMPGYSTNPIIIFAVSQHPEAPDAQNGLHCCGGI